LGSFVIRPDATEANASLFPPGFFIETAPREIGFVRALF